MLKMYSMPLDGFAAALSSSDPAPGGGGASALCAALAAALGGMVTSLTIGKKKYAEVEAEMLALREELGELRVSLLELVERDALAFAPLAAAYRMPAETEEQRAEKEISMQASLKGASAPPLEVMRLCARVAELLEPLAQKGSRLAVSDAGAAAALCAAAMRAASLNVYINAAAITDTVAAKALKDEADALLESGAALADGVYAEVRRELIQPDRKEG